MTNWGIIIRQSMSDRTHQLLIDDINEQSIGHKILGHRLGIDYPLIIAKTQWLLSWLPNDYSSITHWCHSSRLVMFGNLALILILHYPPMQAFLGEHVFRRRNTSDEIRAGRLNPDLFTVGHTSILSWSKHQTLTMAGTSHFVFACLLILSISSIGE